MPRSERKRAARREAARGSESELLDYRDALFRQVDPMAEAADAKAAIPSAVDSFSIQRNAKLLAEPI